MKKQILNIGKALSRAEQKLVFGGNLMMYEDDGGICQITYPNMPAGCFCNNGNQCVSGSCNHSSGNQFHVCG